MCLIFEILIGISAFFAVSGAIGLLRLPDVYTRIHANTVATVGGTIFLCLTLAAKSYSISPLFSTKLIFLALILSLTAPTASYYSGKAAFRSGIGHWRKK